VEGCRQSVPGQWARVTAAMLAGRSYSPWKFITMTVGRAKMGMEAEIS